MSKLWVRGLRPRLRHLKNRFRPRNLRLADQNPNLYGKPSSHTQAYKKDSEAYLDSVPEPLNPDFTRFHAFAERAIWYLRDIHFLPRHSVLAAGRRIISDSKTSGAQGASRPLFAFVARAPDDHQWLPLGHQPWNYYHWLLEDLPAVIRGRNAVADLSIALPPAPPLFVTDSLELLGVPFRIFPSVTRFRRVVLPGRGVDPGWPHRDDVQLLRDFGMQLGMNTPADRSGRKIMVSRRYSTRGLENEAEFESWLAERGFEVLYAERFSFAEQVNVFSQASVIVGPHGAGLSNLVFSSPSAALIEVGSPLRADPCFENLARVLGCPYSRVFATPGKWVDSSILDSDGFESIDRVLTALQVEKG